MLEMNKYHKINLNSITLFICIHMIIVVVMTKIIIIIVIVIITIIILYFFFLPHFFKFSK
jgi:hypothetical protein